MNTPFSLTPKARKSIQIGAALRTFPIDQKLYFVDGEYATLCNYPNIATDSANFHLQQNVNTTFRATILITVSGSNDLPVLYYSGYYKHLLCRVIITEFLRYKLRL